MLPIFEDRKSAAGKIMSRRMGKPLDEERAAEREAPGGEMHAGLKAACEDLLSAIENKSPLDMGKALKAVWQACEESGGAESEGESAPSDEEEP